jgi:hypothetical protein
MLSYYEDKEVQTHISKFISILIIQILHNITTLQFIDNIFDNSFLTRTGLVITHSQLIST